MNPLRGKLAWLPSFLLGAVGAAAAVLAGALLLYADRGLLRSLTAILATELVGLGLGLVSSRRMQQGDLGSVRRRWLAALLAYAGAAGFAAAWAVGGGFAAAPWAQGLGLALLGGLPLFAIGSVLASLPATGQPRGSVAGPAVLGGAAGVVAAGLFGVPSFEPPSVLLFCVVAVSVAALVHGWQVDGRVVVKVLAEDPGDGRGPVLRLEERIRGDPERRGWIVVVDGRPAVGTDGDGEPLLPWERAAAELATNWRGEGGGRVLVVGGAGHGLVRGVAGGDGGDGVAVLEPWGRARDLRPSTSWGEGDVDERRCVDLSAVGSLAPFRVVVVALRLLPGGGPVAGDGLAVLETVAAARARDGILLLGGVDLEAPDEGCGTGSWIAGQGWCPPEVALLRPRGAPGRSGEVLLLPHEGVGGGLIAAGSDVVMGLERARSVREMEVNRVVPGADDAPSRTEASSGIGEREDVP